LAFTDPETGQVQNDPFAGTATAPTTGTVYVAWNTLNATPASTPPFHIGNLGLNFNPNTIKLMASNNGGVTFSTQAYGNDGTGDPNYSFPAPNIERDAYPQLTVSQGTAHNVGVAPRVSEGQLNITWHNFGPTTVVPQASIEFDRVKDGGVGLQPPGMEALPRT